jgi:hypothetical protein
LLEAHFAVPVRLDQARRHGTEPQSLPHDMRRNTKPGGDFFRAQTALVRQLLKGLELVSRVQRLGYASSVLLAGLR